MSHYNVSRKPAVNPQGGWANASYEFTWAVEEVTDGREDLIVKICPDAAYDDQAYDRDGKLIRDRTGKPVAEQNAAVTFMELGVIEINPNLLPVYLQNHPEDIHPLSRQDRKQYPVVWGAAIHEAAHADHSLWVMEASRKLGDFTPEERQWIGAAMLLEESRIEKAQIERRPQDQPWIEAAGLHVAVKEYADACNAVAKLRKENPVFVNEDLSRYQTGRAAALALARVDSGSVFRSKEITSIKEIVKQAFGKDFNKLRAVWLEAQDTADDDLPKMLELGHRWYDLTRDSGNDRQPCGITVQAGGSPQSTQDQTTGIGQALSDSASQAEAEASGEAEAARHRNRVNARANATAQEAAAQQSAQETAQKTFGARSGAGAGIGGRTSHPVTGHRKPTRDEISRARATRRRLEAAYIPEKSVTKVTQAMPPGRLSMRDVQQRAAQRAQGMVPSAEPFTYTDRKHNTTPPLKVGIVQDVSGSQGGAANAAVSGAWSLAKAAVDIPGAQVAMVSFGDDVHAIIKPSTRVDEVPMISAHAGTRHFLAAVKAVEGQLNLTRPGSARLLVILTDGQFASTVDQSGRDAAMKRLTSHGVKILWVDTDGQGMDLPAKMPGLRISTSAAYGNNSAIPSVICHEAVNALTQ